MNPLVWTSDFAQVPEGLLPTVTISLMIASEKMSERKVLIRKLDAVETLGCVSVIRAAGDRFDRSRGRSIESIDSIDSIIFRSFAKFLKNRSR